MPFPFVYVCDILDRLERPHLRDVPPLPMHLKSSSREMTIEWFKLHRHRLNHFNTCSEAVLAMLQPETIIDRVYGLDADRVELIVARALRLKREHFIELQEWRHPGKGDLGDLTSRVLEQFNILPLRSLTNSVTVEEIDQTLLRIAAFQAGSSETVRSLAKDWARPDEVALLGAIYGKLQGRECKWLTRFILKDYGRVKLPQDLALGSNHSILPNCLQVSVQLSAPTSSAVRLDGTGVVRGLTGPAVQPQPAPGSNPAVITDPTVITLNFPPTPPTSSAPHVASSASVTVHRKPHISNPPCTQTHNVPRSSPPTARPALAPLSSPSQNSQRPLANSSQAPTTAKQPARKPSKRSCQLAPQSCGFSHCVFILSPCIADSSHTVHTLLCWHGLRYTTHLTHLASPHHPRRSHATNKRYRRIILVESRRAEQTVEFLRRVTKLRSKRDESCEKLEVYDWRLLESISKLELGRELTHDPWERLWMLDI